MEKSEIMNLEKMKGVSLQPEESANTRSEKKAAKSTKRQHYFRENLYAHIDLTVKQMDQIIVALLVLLTVAVAIGLIIR
jgi:hypothetical protein